jgi:pyruvate/2-oxoglutarate dehydrogenase complex dihydrolipoamide dehydrogenase (E3) component
VPSKALLRAARAWHEVHHGQNRFAAPSHLGSGDFPAVMERMRKLRAEISKHDSAGRFQSLGVDVYLGDARFVAEDAVAVGDLRLRFKRAVIATGARPERPSIPGLAEVGFLTNETLWNLTALPRRLAVIGGGPIGAEMAQAFSRFGAYVALFDGGPQILHREDPDAAAIVQAALQRDGVRLELGVRIVDLVPRGRGGDKQVRFERAGENGEFVASDVLVATGRLPNVQNMGLDVAGVAVGANGVQVDDALRTTNKRIFAAGDVCSAYRFTHNSDAQARIVIQNALFPKQAKSSAVTLPWCTYTSPELAHVGLTASEAGSRGIAIETITIPLEDVDRARLDGESEGFLRLLIKKGGDRILGATVVAEHAGEMIATLGLAVTHGIGLGRIAATVFPYPTQSEALKKAADAWRRTKLTPGVKRLLRLWLAFK